MSGDGQAPVPPADYPFTFACRRSGNCCAVPGGLVRVDDADVAAIAAHLGMGEPAVRSRFVAASGDRLVDGFGSRCVFLADGPQASCTIYPVRPQKCRDWPYWPELRDDPQLLAKALRTCPGLTPR